VASTAKLAGLLRTAQTELRILNRTRGLTTADKERLKSHYLRHVFIPQAAQLLPPGKIAAPRPAATTWQDGGFLRRVSWRDGCALM